MLVVLYAIVLLTVALFLVAGIRLLISARPVSPAGPPECEVESARYLPMVRLLRGEDDRYLSAQGFDRRAIRRFRTGRRVIFRGYLRCLRSDFGMLADCVRLAMVASSVPRADLARALFRARALFALGVVAVEFRLALHALGAPEISIDASPLIQALDRMQAQSQLASELPAIPA